MAERAGLGTGGSRCGRQRVPRTDRRRSSTTAPATTSVRSAPAEPAAAGSRPRTAHRSSRRSSARTPTRTIRQKLAKLYTMQQIGRFSSLRAKSPRSAHGRRAEHREADDERPAAAATRGRQRDHRPDGMVMGTDTPGGGVVQEIDAVLARSVDLRRHRPGAAQHHRRARARPARRSPAPPRTRRSAASPSVRSRSGVSG